MQHKLFVRERKWWSCIFCRHIIFFEKGKFVSNAYRTAFSEDLLPYLINILLQICTRINHAMKNKLPYCKFWNEIPTKSKLINLFTQKDKILSALHSGTVYKFTCSSWNAKLCAIWKSECVNSLVFLPLLEKEWKGITILLFCYYLFCILISFIWLSSDYFLILAGNNNLFSGCLNGESFNQ